VNDNPRGWRALARFNPATLKLSVVIGRPGGDDGVQYVAGLPANASSSIEHRDFNDHTPPPEIHMDESVAKALLEALAEHFGGTGDTRTLRKDYEAERARVDRLVGHLISADQRVEYRTVTP
jgi:hypothetical protein